MLDMTDKKTPVTLRLNPQLLRRLDAVVNLKRPAVTRTAAIEDAIDQWLTSQEGDADANKRKGVRAESS